ncbi:MAG TPA: homocysteine S-methyltransferase family protein [Solirubrobacteraceae bacterium]|jgi:homocysteine S-methyltransferase|nr:homocysteine S-methyltransferase family protein [Solirubrobacteraceae bacterium]
MTAPLDHIRRLRGDGRLVVIDGGMGSELEAQGAGMDHDAWSGLVNLADPALVRRVHEDYVRAGADVLITNTFMAGSGPLERARAGERFALANRNAVRAAREATATADRPIVIAGSVSVTQLGAPETATAHPATGGEEHRRLRDGYTRQIEVLAQEGVDLVALEMVDHPRYAEPAVEAALSCGLPVWLGLCVHGDERDRGEGPAPAITDEHRQVARLAQGDSFDAVCVMHTDIDDVDAVLGLVAESWDGAVGVYPHHGVWKRPSWQFLDLPAERFAELAQGWHASGVSMIGGCCGIGPGQIAALEQLRA